MQEVVGTALAGRRLGDVLGRDLVSTTYAATEAADGVGEPDRAVTVRAVAEDLCVADGPDRELYERFLAEAAAALTFDHPDAGLLEEVGEDHGRGYLVTTVVDAEPFGTWVGAGGAATAEVALPVLSRTAAVLDALHAAGLVHGAVNPRTLLVSTGGDPSPVLTGHGVGALLELRLRRDRRQLDVVHDLLYVTPEQLRRQPPDPRTDQYALACAVVHALTGAPPFVRDSVGGLFGAHLFVAPGDAGDGPWAVAVRRGLAKDPEDRFPSCGALVEAVEAAVRRGGRRRRPPPLHAAGAGIDLRPGTTDDAGVASSAGSDDGARPRAAAGATAVPDGAPDDNSGTGWLTGASMAYAHAQEEGPASDDDVPLLSEVLRRRPPEPQPAVWRPPGVLVVLVLIALAAAAATVWLTGT